MYGDCNYRLHKRMYMAWRRRRVGSVRDRVLSSLQSEGLFTFSDSVPASANSCESQREVDSQKAANVENYNGGVVGDCCSVTNSENVIESCQHNVSGESENGTNDERVTNCESEKDHRRLIVTRYWHKNHSNVVHIRHKSTVPSYSLKGKFCYE